MDPEFGDSNPLSYSLTQDHQRERKTSTNKNGDIQQIVTDSEVWLIQFAHAPKSYFYIFWPPFKQVRKWKIYQKQKLIVHFQNMLELWGVENIDNLENVHEVFSSKIAMNYGTYTKFLMSQSETLREVAHLRILEEEIVKQTKELASGKFKTSYHSDLRLSTSGLPSIKIGKEKTMTIELISIYADNLPSSEANAAEALSREVEESQINQIEFRKQIDAMNGILSADSLEKMFDIVGNQKITSQTMLGFSDRYLITDTSYTTAAIIRIHLSKEDRQNLTEDMKKSYLRAFQNNLKHFQLDKRQNRAVKEKVIEGIMSLARIPHVAYDK